MTTTTKVFSELSEEEVLDMLLHGYEGLPVTGAEEVDGEASNKFYDADMWVSHIEAHGFDSCGLYDHVEVKTVFHDDGEAQFSYLAFVLRDDA